MKGAIAFSDSKKPWGQNVHVNSPHFLLTVNVTVFTAGGKKASAYIIFKKYSSRVGICLHSMTSCLQVIVKFRYGFIYLSTRIKFRYKTIRSDFRVASSRLQNSWRFGDEDESSGREEEKSLLCNLNFILKAVASRCIKLKHWVGFQAFAISFLAD